MTVGKKIFVSLLFFGSGMAFSSYFLKQNPNTALLTENVVIIFAIIFGFATTMLVMVANWEIPEAERDHTEQVIGVLNAVTLDIRLLIFSSLFMVVALNLPTVNFLWKSLLFGIAVMVIPLTFFAVRDLSQMRKIRSYLKLWALEQKENQHKKDKINHELSQAIAREDKHGCMETVGVKVSSV